MNKEQLKEAMAVTQDIGFVASGRPAHYVVSACCVVMASAIAQAEPEERKQLIRLMDRTMEKMSTALQKYK
jgi:hypothetical protein